MSSGMLCYVNRLPMSEGIMAYSYLITQLHTSLTDVIHTYMVKMT